MFPDLFGILDSYSDYSYYDSDIDPEVKSAFMDILRKVHHEREIKYVGESGNITGTEKRILKKALELLHTKRNIYLRFDLDATICNFAETSKFYSLWLEVKEGLDKDRIQVDIPKNAFTERWLPTDDYAGVSSKINTLDDITYKAVRIAYIIHQAIKNN